MPIFDRLPGNRPAQLQPCHYGTPYHGSPYEVPVVTPPTSVRAHSLAQSKQSSRSRKREGGTA